MTALHSASPIRSARLPGWRGMRRPRRVSKWGLCRPGPRGPASARRACSGKQSSRIRDSMRLRVRGVRRGAGAWGGAARTPHAGGAGPARARGRPRGRRPWTARPPPCTPAPAPAPPRALVTSRLGGHDADPRASREREREREKERERKRERERDRASPPGRGAPPYRAATSPSERGLVKE